MSVHYKFKSAVEYDTLPVDGVNISLIDLKEAIIYQKKLGYGQPYDLQVTNAETKEVYLDDKALIPKNSSLIIARIPLDSAAAKKWEGGKDPTELLLMNPDYRLNTEGSEEAERISRIIAKAPDLTKLEASEEEKINVMMAQSAIDYHSSRYVKLRNTKMSGQVPSTYKCYKCHQGGHWVINCPLNNQDLRKSTGIPSQFLVEVENAKIAGAMITPGGKFVVFRQSLSVGENPDWGVIRKAPKPPRELLCLICGEVLCNAVLTPCCANAYCDECIRNHLLENDEQQCFSCSQTNVQPDTLIPNRYLRLKILEFGNQFEEEVINTPDQLNQTSVPNSPRFTPPLIRSPLARTPPPLKPSNGDAEGTENTREGGDEVVVVGECVEGTTATSGDDGVLSPHKKKHGKKKKKEEKEKKKKKEKKEKKEKKKKKQKEVDLYKNIRERSVSENNDAANVSSDSLMTEALLSFDPTVPPPNMAHSAPISSHHYAERRPAPDIPTNYSHSVKHEENIVEKFEDFLKAKEKEKEKERRKRYLHRQRTRSRSPPSLRRLRSISPQSRTPSPGDLRFSRLQTYSPHTPRRRLSPPSPFRHRSPFGRNRSPSYSRSPSPGVRYRKLSPINRNYNYSPYSPQRHSGGADYLSEHSSYGGRDSNSYNRLGNVERGRGLGAARRGRHGYEGRYRDEDELGMRKVMDLDRRGGGLRRMEGLPPTRGGEDRYRPMRGEDDRRKRGFDYEEVNGRRWDTSVSPVDRRKGRERELLEGRRRERERDKPRERRSRSRDSMDRYYRKGYSPVRKGHSPKEFEGPRRDRERGEKRMERKEHPLYNKDVREERQKEDKMINLRELGRVVNSKEKREVKVVQLAVKESENGKMKPDKILRLDAVNKEMQATADDNMAIGKELDTRKISETEAKDKKHEKKKKKKEKRRSSQVSTNEGEASAMEEEKNRKKDKKHKELEKGKAQSVSPRSQKVIDKSLPSATTNEALSAYLPALSKWERDDDEPFSSPKIDPTQERSEAAKEMQKVVTSDVIKRAENAIFSMNRPFIGAVGRALGEREAKRKGSSIQITISSKTESSIGQVKKPSEQEVTNQIVSTTTTSVADTSAAVATSSVAVPNFITSAASNTSKQGFVVEQTNAVNHEIETHGKIRKRLHSMEDIVSKRRKSDSSCDKKENHGANLTDKTDSGMPSADAKEKQEQNVPQLIETTLVILKTDVEVKANMDGKEDEKKNSKEEALLEGECEVHNGSESATHQNDGVEQSLRPEIIDGSHIPAWQTTAQTKTHPTSLSSSNSSSKPIPSQSSTPLTSSATPALPSPLLPSSSPPPLMYSPLSECKESELEEGELIDEATPNASPSPSHLPPQNSSHTPPLPQRVASPGTVAIESLSASQLPPRLLKGDLEENKMKEIGRKRSCSLSSTSSSSSSSSSEEEKKKKKKKKKKTMEDGSEEERKKRRKKDKKKKKKKEKKKKKKEK